ncbi:GntR family transcriptional regulator [Roseovarius aestuarii]|nr:GntR family transcriptional regulator [Roseovarius aestuarii]
MTEPRRNIRQNHLALAQKILSVALDRGMTFGDHLPETTFSTACGVSRTPIRSAFKLLEERDILEWRSEEGYFLAIESAAELNATIRSLEETEHSVAHQILSDRAERRIGAVQSVSALSRRYKMPRASVLNALKVLSRDGLVRQLPGRAWAFQSMVDSPDAVEDSFDFRIVMEPQAVLAPDFVLDTKRASLLREQMSGFLNAGDTGVTPAGFGRIDIAFHTFVAECSGNRFLRASLSAHHRLRKASQKTASTPAFRLRQAMLEHLEILDSLERNQFQLAADQITVHLRRSRIRKPQAANRGIPPLAKGPRT